MAGRKRLEVARALVRNVGDIAKLAAVGCDTFTVSAQIAEAMFADPLTAQAAADFEAAAERIGAYDAAAAEKERRAAETSAAGEKGGAAEEGSRGESN